MFQLIEKIILAGVGLANLTKEKAENLVDSLVEKGQIQAKDKKAILSRLLKGTEQLDRDLEKKMKQVSLSVVKNSQKQIDALNNKLGQLVKKLEAEKKKNSASNAKSNVVVKKKVKAKAKKKV
jgi:polyhydroxyalkanoate synthesis regulator phasin